MIPVTLQTEPPQFDAKVRVPGNTFLASCPLPSAKDWKKHNYWRHVNCEMYQFYQGVCAYTGGWFPQQSAQVSLQPSIDHFLPKSQYPQFAYEWHNYRLTTHKTNNYKADNEGIVDPFCIKLGWFTLILPSCLIEPGSEITAHEREMIAHTISVLKLNDDDIFVDSRCGIIQSYIEGSFMATDMQRKYPFIASELKRQDLLDIEKLKLIFKPLCQKLRVNQLATT